MSKEATRRLLLVLLLAGLALPPLLGANTYFLRVMNFAWIAAIAALGLNVATGITGQIVLGQAALMGVGSYATALAMTSLHLPWPVALAGGIALTALVGIGLGFVSTRIKGHYLAITTLALNEIFRLFVLNEDWLTGGPLGMRDIPGPQLAWLDPLFGAEPDRKFYLPLFTITLLTYALTLRLYRTRLGRDMRAVRDDELAAEAMGINSRATKTFAFVVCSLWAGLAGGLYALLVGFLSPNNFTIFESIRLVLMAVIGGLGSVAGTFLGAIVVTVLPEVLRGLQTYYLAAFGIGVVAILLVAPRGLGVVGDWLVARWLAGPRGDAGGDARTAGTTWGPSVAAAIDLATEDSLAATHPAATSVQSPEKPARSTGEGLDAAASTGRPWSPTILAVHELSKRFGGIAALDRVSFEVREGEILGLIGPNGSGKSTLINACAGILPVSGGSIEIAGVSLLGRAPWDIHAAGVSRIFQNVRLWESLTVLENVMVPQPDSRGGSTLASLVGGPAFRKREALARDAALDALELMGIRSLADRRAGDLSFGQSRLVELARAIVSRPRLLLLDEPAAGLRGGLVMVLAEILRRLRDRGMTVLVVEHRIKLVMSLCDRVVVLNLGEKIAEGTPLVVQRDPAVIDAYLGGKIDAGDEKPDVAGQVASGA